MLCSSTMRKTKKAHIKIKNQYTQTAAKKEPSKYQNTGSLQSSY